MSITQSLIDWLSTFEQIGHAERITQDSLGSDALSLGMLPDDHINYYLDGSRDITKYFLFRLRLQTLSHGDRKEASHLCYDIEQSVWKRNLQGDLPVLDANHCVQGVAISQPPYLLQTDGKDGIYQMGLAINYIEKRDS